MAYKGPCVLPWLWEDVTYGGEVLLKPQPIPFRAGPEGEAFSACDARGSAYYRLIPAVSKPSTHW